MQKVKTSFYKKTCILFSLMAVIPVCSCQSRILYHPDKRLVAHPSDIKLKYSEFTVASGDGAVIHGWWIPYPGARRQVLFCHGNAGNISHRLSTVKILNDLKLGVCIFDYRGYGRSTGSPTERGTYDDAASVWKYMVETLGIGPGDIIVMGRSLGGAVAAQLASIKSPGMLIIESSFVSFREIIHDHCSLCTALPIFSYDYDTGRHVSKVACPVLVIHSRDDEIIPYRHGIAVYDSVRSKKKFLEISGSHNGGFLDSGNRYIKGLYEFIYGNKSANTTGR